MDSQRQMGARNGRRNGNVIAMRLDAAFFFERGVRYLERNDMKRALKAFRKTIEYEPDNPVNHCNLAGVLAELGDFEASNEILLHVLQDLDPDMAECRFYLANNYANMGQYEAAEECVLSYLDACPDGEFAEEAEEMLDILLDEFGGGKAYARWQERRRQEERASALKDGRHLLENGQFEAAMEWLERTIDREPENMAARNNLSLAYYYTGQYERAVACAEQVLAKEPGNLHALCNLTVFLAHLGPREAFLECVRKVKNLFPLHYDHAMKLGTTLGLVGEHRAALEVFRKLARMVGTPEPTLVHCLAAAAANTRQYRMARYWWRQLQRDDEVKDVAAYFLACLDEAERSNKPLRFSYQYEIPAQTQWVNMHRRLSSIDVEEWRNHPLLRAMLYWALRNGEEDAQYAAIRLLCHLADDDAEKALRSFLKRSDISFGVQAAALYALQRMGRADASNGCKTECRRPCACRRCRATSFSPCVRSGGRSTMRRNSGCGWRTNPATSAKLNRCGAIF
ncbi:hypothetical protein GCM10025857_16160 [Alicyclobacillus contaminans]|nr:hypothetical protein GCM10025857_16160 [Alicyclobacillus contaminans]